mmetsp:Transcript_19/g.52  ORF Transcript_19/g.52 Transcript_19/m.52 type:complete len:139 (-) Transcript_19:806-1222(-)
MNALADYGSSDSEAEEEEEEEEEKEEDPVENGVGEKRTSLRPNDKTATTKRARKSVGEDVQSASPSRPPPPPPPMLEDVIEAETGLLRTRKSTYIKQAERSERGMLRPPQLSAKSANVTTEDLEGMGFKTQRSKKRSS